MLTGFVELRSSVFRASFHPNIDVGVYFSVGYYWCEVVWNKASPLSCPDRLDDVFCFLYRSGNKPLQAI